MNAIKSGCLILAGLLVAGLVIAVVVFGLNLWRSAGERQVVTAIAGLDDRTSPELVSERRATAEARLDSYGWVDQGAGIVRIPIEQAMAEVADKGLPVGSVEEPTPTEAAPTETPAPEATEEAPAGGTPLTEAAPTATPEPTATPAPTVDLANVSFKENVLPIFEQHCTECHGGDEPKEGLRLTSFAEIMAGSWNGSVIEPGDVENSYLIEQVVTGRMPKKGPHLTPAEIEIITAWVKAGAPDN